MIVYTNSILRTFNGERTSQVPETPIAIIALIALIVISRNVKPTANLIAAFYPRDKGTNFHFWDFYKTILPDISR